ncbi:MAG: hypothetical protein KGQ69_00430 [Rhodospirillales bacterium]|nr:hypothetical protein [Rhodospirillales bacterium]
MIILVAHIAGPHRTALAIMILLRAVVLLVLLRAVVLLVLLWTVVLPARAHLAVGIIVLILAGRRLGQSGARQKGQRGDAGKKCSSKAHDRVLLLM